MHQRIQVELVTTNGRGFFTPMTSLATSLNASLAAGEAARLSQAQHLRVAEEASALRTALLRQGFPTSGTITASYTFAVHADGSLTPTETRITSKSDLADDAPSGRFSRSAAPRAAVSVSFGSLGRPRIHIAPDQESVLFAGATVAERTSNVISITAQLQRTTAALYARNSDVTYNAYPLVNVAA